MQFILLVSVQSCRLVPYPKQFRFLQQFPIVRLTNKSPASFDAGLSIQQR